MTGPKKATKKKTQVDQSTPSSLILPWASKNPFPNERNSNSSSSIRRSVRESGTRGRGYYFARRAATVVVMAVLLLRLGTMVTATTTTTTTTAFLFLLRKKKPADC